MTSTIDVRLLGPIEVRVGEATVDLGGPQPRAVIAHLALDLGRVVSVERLVARLWGEQPPASPLGSLHSTLSRLRRVIEPGRGSGSAPTVIVSEAPGYALRLPDESVDLVRFRMAARAGRTAAAAARHQPALADFDAALATWRGPALAGIGPDEVVAPIALALEEERLSVLEDRFDTVLALGRHGDLIGELSTAVSEHPLRERMWSTLAIALYRSQRQADALRAIDQARRTLIDELGLDPGPELRQLEQRILDQDPALLAVPLTPPPAPVEVRPPPDQSLIGRDAEWARLCAALDRGASGVPAVVLLEGEPGIGKSTLAEHLSAYATASGWVIATGRCVDDGLAPALWPIVEIAASAGLADAVSPTPPTSVDAPQSRTPIEIADAVLAALDAHAVDATGWCVFVDDVHWADRSTLDVLALMADRLRGRRAVMMVAMRPVGSVPGSALPDVIARLGRSAERIAVSPLAEAAVAELLKRTSGAEPSGDTVRLVAERAGGNPLFVAELGRLVGEAGVAAAGVPDAVRDLVHARLAPLPAATRAVLELAAVVGERFEVSVVVAASGGDRDACLDALDPAIVTRILVPGRPGELGFTHALVRDAVLAELVTLRRARLHHAVADAIEVVRGTGVDVIETIARHRLAAIVVDDVTKTAEQLVDAANVARWRGALDTADELATEAITVIAGAAPDSALDTIEGRALEAMVMTDSNRPDHPLKPSRMAEAIDRLATRSGSDAARAVALYARWWSVDIGPVAEKRSIADAELALASRSENRYAKVLGFYVAGAHAFLEGRLLESHQWCEQAVVASEALDPSDPPKVAPNVQLPATAGITALLIGDEAIGREHVELRNAAWRRARGRGRLDRTTELDLAYTRAFFAAIGGDPKGARAAISGLDLDDPPVWVLHLANGCAVWEAWSAAMLGDASGAERALIALDAIGSDGPRVLVPSWITFVGEALLAADDQRALPVLARAHDESVQRGEVWWLPETLRLEALAEARFGDPARAEALLVEARELAERQGNQIVQSRLRS